MVNLVLKGNPISTNNCYYHAGRGITFIKAKAKKLKNSYIEQIKKQYKAKPLTCDLQATIRIYFGDKRKHDWDNFHKLSQDAMNKIVFEDDNQIQKAIVEKFYNKENPRIEVLLEEYKKL